MPIVGSTIPDFRLHAYHGEQFRIITRAEVLGRWSVFFFYPADFTFVCPTELADLAEAYPELQRLGVEVYAVSTDTHYTHKAWHDASPLIRRVAFPMLGDPAGVLTRAFEVHDEAEGLALRGSFVCDPQGVIRTAEIHDAGIGRDARELLRKVQAAQHVASHPGEVCPARWRPGASTLKPGIHSIGAIADAGAVGGSAH